MNYLFLGQEPYLKEKAIDSLKSKLLSEKSSDLNFNAYHADIDRIEDILYSLNTLPFTGKNRLIVIKDIDKFAPKERKSLLSYLKKPSPQTTLVLNSEKDVDRDEIGVEVSGLVKKINFDKLKGTKLDAWIITELKTLDKTISPDAVKLLKKLVGEDDLFRLKSELEKISLFVGEKRDISKTDVENIIEKNAEEDIFDLIDAISKKDAENAFGIIWNLLLRKVRPHEIVGLLAWHFRNIQTKGIIGYSFERAKLKRNLELLLSTDFAIKRGKINPNLLLEFAVLKLCCGK